MGCPQHSNPIGYSQMAAINLPRYARNELRDIVRGWAYYGFLPCVASAHKYYVLPNTPERDARHYVTVQYAPYAPNQSAYMGEYDTAQEAQAYADAMNAFMARSFDQLNAASKRTGRLAGNTPENNSVIIPAGAIAMSIALARITEYRRQQRNARKRTMASNYGYNVVVLVDDGYNAEPKKVFGGWFATSQEANRKADKLNAEHNRDRRAVVVKL